VWVGVPRDAVEVNGRTSLLVPQTLRIRVSQGILIQSAFLLGIPEHDSPRWSFIDASGATPATLSPLFPDIAAASLQATPEMPPRRPAVLER
jgi:hypothetical protein